MQHFELSAQSRDIRADAFDLREEIEQPLAADRCFERRDAHVELSVQLLDPPAVVGDLATRFLIVEETGVGARAQHQQGDVSDANEVQAMHGLLEISRAETRPALGINYSP